MIQLNSNGRRCQSRFGSCLTRPLSRRYFPDSIFGVVKNISMKTKLILLAVLLFYGLNYIYFSSQVLFYPNAFTKSLPDMGLSISKMLRLDYPPLHFSAICVGASIFGNRLMFVNGILNTFYLFILIIFSYLLGKKVNEEVTGLIAAVFVSLYPLTYQNYFQVSLDFPLMGLTVMAIYLLVSSEYFLYTKYSVLFAITCGWGMMIKQPFGAFLIGPIIYSLFESIRKCIIIKDYSRLLNILIFIVVSYILIMPYYFPDIFKMHWYMPAVEPSGLMWYDFRNLRIFTIGLWESQLSPLFFIFLIFGAYYFNKKTNIQFKRILFIWILIPNLILIFLPTHKYPRYFIYQLPAFAVVSAFGVRQIIDKRAGKIVLFIAIILGVSQFFQCVYGIGPDINKFNPKWFRYNDAYFIRLENIKFYDGLYGKVYNVLTSRVGNEGFNEENKLKVLIINSISNTFAENIKTYFWCRNTKNVDIRFLVFWRGGMSCLYDIKDEIGKSDYVLYMTNNSMELKNKDFFGLLRKYLTSIERDLYRYGDDEVFWKKYKYLWGSIIDKIGVNELIFDKNDVEVYLYRLKRANYKYEK